MSLRPTVALGLRDAVGNWVTWPTDCTMQACRGCHAMY